MSVEGKEQLAKAEMELRHRLSLKDFEAYQIWQTEWRASLSTTEWQTVLDKLADVGWEVWVADSMAVVASAAKLREAKHAAALERESLAGTPGNGLLESIASIVRGLYQVRLVRYLVGVGIAVGIFAVFTLFQGNEVKDYLAQQGFEVASVSAVTRIHQINVEVDTTDGEYARRVCEALRGVYATDDGIEMRPSVFYDPPGHWYSGTAAQPCRRS